MQVSKILLHFQMACSPTTNNLSIAAEPSVSSKEKNFISSAVIGKSAVLPDLNNPHVVSASKGQTTFLHGQKAVKVEMNTSFVNHKLNSNAACDELSRRQETVENNCKLVGNECANALPSHSRNVKREYVDHSDGSVNEAHVKKKRVECKDLPSVSPKLTGSGLTSILSKKSYRKKTVVDVHLKKQPTLSPEQCYKRSSSTTSSVASICKQSATNGVSPSGDRTNSFQNTPSQEKLLIPQSYSADVSAASQSAVASPSCSASNTSCVPKISSPVNQPTVYNSSVSVARMNSQLPHKCSPVRIYQPVTSRSAARSSVYLASAPMSNTIPKKEVNALETLLGDKGLQQQLQKNSKHTLFNNSEHDCANTKNILAQNVSDMQLPCGVLETRSLDIQDFLAKNTDQSEVSKNKACLPNSLSVTALGLPKSSSVSLKDADKNKEDHEESGLDISTGE